MSPYNRFAAVAALGLAIMLPLGSGAAVMTEIPRSASTPPIPVYVVRPHGPGPFPAVVFLHGCEGFNGFYAVAADRLAAKGYVAVAIDSLGVEHPAGGCDGGPGGSETEAADARATLAWLRTQPYVIADRLGVMGFSMGGRAVLDLIDGTPGNAAPIPGLRAAVAFYPACEGRGAHVTVPLRIFDGDADRITPSAPCVALANSAKAANQPVDITVYPGATHGFLIPGPARTFYGEPIVFDEAGAADAAKKIETFFGSTLR